MSVEVELKLRKWHTGQERLFREKKRFNVVSCGRRFGKTAFGLDLLVDNPGKGALDGFPQGWFAPNYKYLDEPWREAKKLLAPITSRVDQQLRRIELITGGVLDFWTTEGGDPGRSRKYKQIFFDEAAKEKKLNDVWLGAIRPTLSDLKGDAWFLSSPRGLDAFYKLYLKGQKFRTEYDPTWQSWIMPTSANPWIDKDEIEEARKAYAGVPLLFKQEYLGEFITDAGAVFKLEWLVEGVAPARFSHLYVSWDLAVTEGDLERGDWSVGVVIGQDALGRYWLLDVIRGRWNSAELVEKMLKAAGKYNAARSWYEGGPIGSAVEPWIRKRQAETGQSFYFEKVPHSGRGDKVVRTGPLVAVMANRSFYVPKGATWLECLRDELAGFPNGEFDDQVDALSQAFLELQAIRQSTAVPTAGATDPGRVTGQDIAERSAPKARDGVIIGDGDKPTPRKRQW